MRYDAVKDAPACQERSVCSRSDDLTPPMISIGVTGRTAGLSGAEEVRVAKERWATAILDLGIICEESFGPARAPTFLDQ